MTDETDETAEILVVCTGNIARSPFCEGLLREDVRRRFGPDAPVRVRSAGVHGLEGRAAVAEMRDEAASRGVDLEDHRGAAVTPEDLEAADLVVAMTENHRRRMLQMAPGAKERIFTLKELVRLLGSVETPDGGLTPAERVRAVAHRAHRARPRAPQPDGPEDVRDPYGGSRAGYREVAAEIETLVSGISDVLFGRDPGRTP